MIGNNEGMSMQTTHHDHVCTLLCCDGAFLGVLFPPTFARPRSFSLPAQVHYILDEIIMGGMVVETNKEEILRAIDGLNRTTQPVPSLNPLGGG